MIRKLLFAILLYTAVLGIVLMIPKGGVSAFRNRPDTPPGCSDESIMRVENGSREYVASIIERDCGATTNFVRSIYIVYKKGGDPYSYEHPLAVANGQGISTIRWKDDRTLVVEYDPKGTPFFQQHIAMGDFTVVYHPRAAEPLR